jgi:hypothetical protein
MRRSTLAIAAIAAVAILAGCVPAASPPPPTPAPRPTPAPAPSPTPVPLGADWNDWPVTPGDWVYRQDGRGSIALYGPVGSDALVTLRCDRGRSTLYLSVHGPASSATVRTTSLSRAIPLQSTGGDAGYVATALTPSDSLLDAMAFSRGRFVIAPGGGQNPLVVPPYAEIGRVIEDCRG